MRHSTCDLPSLPGATRRGGTVLATALLTVGIGCVIAPASATGNSTVPAIQPLVVLLQDHPARSKPNPGAHRIESVAARRPLTRVRTVLPVLARAPGAGASSWVQVRLPGRPNGHKGWISTRQTRGTFTVWHVSVKLSARRVTVYLSTGTE